MILSCPSCAARFKVNADQLGVAGRKVRCAKCGNTWYATPDQDEEAPAQRPDEAAGGDEAAANGDAGSGEGDDDLPDTPPPFESFEAMREQLAGGGGRRARSRPAPPPPKRSRFRALAPWLVFLAVVAGLVYGTWAYRYTIVETLPTAARLYAAAGVSINTVAPGLSIESVTPSRRLKNGDTLLVISGEVVNNTDSTQPVPALEVILEGQNGAVLNRWEVAAESAAIPPRGSTAFTAQMTNPPDRADGVTIGFVRPGS